MKLLDILSVDCIKAPLDAREKQGAIHELVDLLGARGRVKQPALLKEAAGRLSHKFLFGSDYPFIPPDRWLRDFDALEGWSDEARAHLLWRNGQQLLAHTPVAQMTFTAES